MAGLQGMANIADDLIVPGRDTEELDKNLHSVLQHLSEKQLTLNAEKCTFRMSKVVFMGLFLRKHGVGLTKEKVRAVAEASQAQTPSEVRSFLGLVGFSSGLYLILQPLLIPSETSQEKENCLCGMRSRSSHFRD